MAKDWKIPGTLEALALALLLGPGHAAAEEGHRFPLAASYREECGSCHVAYPPALLPAASWRAILGGLDRHFGTDASLDAGKAKEIGRFLETHAGAGQGSPLRITETAWFRREHRNGHDGLSASVWKSPAVGSPANCGACHRQAADGDYGEGHIRLP